MKLSNIIEEFIKEMIENAYKQLALQYVLEKFFGRKNVRTFEPDDLYDYPYYRIKRKKFDQLTNDMKRELMSYLAYRKFESELTDDFLYIRQDQGETNKC